VSGSDTINNDQRILFGRVDCVGADLHFIVCIDSPSAISARYSKLETVWAAFYISQSIGNRNTTKVSHCTVLYRIGYLFVGTMTAMNKIAKPLSW
jgi:outer membrane lipoprotein-sorting protein